MDDAGRVAVVTGGAGGIGFGLAEIAAARGMRVALADVEDEALAAARTKLEASGAAVLSVRTDVSDAAAVQALADQVFDTWGSVDLLCSNAGVQVPVSRPTWALSPDDWQWVMGVNTWGFIHSIQAFLPRMIEQDTPGHVLVTCSAAGVIAGPSLAAYKASKHAVMSIGESLLHDLRAAGAPIGVSIFSPDVVKTGLRQSARNRPSHLQDGAERSASESAAEEQMASSPGISAAEAAQIAWQGVEEGRVYLFTSDWAVGAARERLEDMEAGTPRVVTLRDVADE